jgi:uncharacterized delta-60 repeat protein
MAAAGDLDGGFGDGSGFAFSAVPSPSDIAEDSQGRLLVPVANPVAPPDPIAVAAFLPDGSIDPTFGDQGVATFDFANLNGGRHVVVDSQDRIVVSAPERSTGLTVAVRFLPDGTLDPSFGPGGAGYVHNEVVSSPDAMALGPDDSLYFFSGRVYPGQVSRFSFGRLLEDGEIDTDFGDDGRGWVDVPLDPVGGSFSITGSKLVVGSNGELIGAGYAQYPPGGNTGRGLLAGVTEDGDPLAGFGTTASLGLAEAEGGFLRGLTAVPGGGFAVAGVDNPSSYLTVTKLTATGSPDASFSGDGTVDVTQNDADTGIRVTDLLAQPDGRLILVAYGRAPVPPHGRTFVLFRLLPDGSLDPAFGQGGVAMPYLGEDVFSEAALLDSNQKVVVAGEPQGSRTTALARYETQGDQPPGGGTAGEVASSGRGVQVHKLVSPRSFRKLASRGIRALVSCELDCRALVEVRVSRGAANAMGLAGTLVARGSRTLGAERRGWVVATLTARAERALRDYTGGGNFKVKVRGVAP